MKNGLTESLVRLIERLRTAEMRLLAQGLHEKAREIRVVMQGVSRWRDAMVTASLKKNTETLGELTGNLDQCSAALSLYIQGKTDADQAFNNLLRLVIPALGVLERLLT